jgi:hypothetical protein
VSSNSDGSQLMITLIKRAFLYEIFSSCSDDMVRYNQFFFFFLILSPVVNTAHIVSFWDY